MKIALIAPTGNIGSEIARNALARSHQVTGIVRNERTLPVELNGVQQRVADVLDTAALAQVLQGHDVVASAFGPSASDVNSLLATTQALVAAVRAAGLKRLVVVGGAGSLEVAPGVQLVDTPNFPAAYREIALAHREAFNFLRTVNDIDWTFFAPAALIGPGEKRGGYRVAANTLLTDAEGNSRIHYPDYAEAFVTELETAQHPRQILTVAYQ